MNSNPEVIDISSDLSAESLTSFEVTPTPLAVMLPSFPPVTVFLTKEMERVVADMNKISIPEKPQSSQRCKGPLKVVIGLAFPKLWGKDMQARGVHKRMPDPKDKNMGKGKRKME